MKISLKKSPIMPLFDFLFEKLLLVDGARKLADGDQLMWKQTVLVRGG
jgi:hypothetical protein